MHDDSCSVFKEWDTTKKLLICFEIKVTLVVECRLDDASELAMRMAYGVHGAYHAIFRHARLTQVDQNVQLPVGIFVL